MGEFTETELALIGAQSVRWPAADTSVQWEALHKVITTVRQAARNADTEITAVEGDPELSLQGKKRRSAEIAVKAINSLETGTHLPHVGGSRWEPWDGIPENWRRRSSCR